METRRDFLKKAAMLSGAAGLSGMLPPSIARALSIDPAPGSTFMDAEHVVILMQENRSFDHCYGSLQGVRGFNDPRAITLPDKKPVWLQTNAEGKTYAPFRLNIKDTRATWMGSLPHSWTNQVDARNDGKYDQWLEAKKAGNPEFAEMPLTLGYYTREDLPFYYSLADAFTVCDQNFCSSLTGTTPNRLYLWTGTVRANQKAADHANVRNEDLDYDKWVKWTTFPERLEDANIAWKIYQNEISVGVGFTSEQDAWLANFTDNPIEWFEQYHVKFLPAYMKFLPQKIKQLTADVKEIEKKLKSLPENGKETEAAREQLKYKRTALAMSREELKKYTPDNYNKLTPREKALHERAFVTNVNDPAYHELTPLRYRDGNTDREVNIPKGDVLYQFREDVKNKKLPTVSWLVAPENFSDHPGAPWYGAWYLSEVLDILTQDAEVWKKTIFILCYDENDGYFDHVPPFTAPNPNKPGSGKVSEGIDAAVEYVTLEQDKTGRAEGDFRAGSIGLGYRVPLVIASPWSRGGAVCSEVFDHTSILQFLEKFLSQKGDKKIEETNISAWRRTVCGDLTSVFLPYQGEKITLPEFVKREPFIESIHQAKFKQNPTGYHALTQSDIDALTRDPKQSQYMPRQEPGTRASRALPYELYVDGKLSADRKTLQVEFEARNEVFADTAAGAPYNVYAPGKYKGDTMRNWNYAVKAGDLLTDTWPLHHFEGSRYHLCIHGPNGFYRELAGTAQDPALDVACVYSRSGKSLTGNIDVRLINNSNNPIQLEIIDHGYKKNSLSKPLAASDNDMIVLDLSGSHGWYDFSVRVIGVQTFERRYAGRVETGKEGVTDPAMA